MVLAANDIYGHGSLESLAETSPSTVQMHLQKRFENQAWRFVDRFEIDDTLGHQDWVNILRSTELAMMAVTARLPFVWKWMKF